MRIGKLTGVLVAAGLAALGPACSASAAEPAPASAASPAPAISPSAERLLKRMSDYLGSAQAFTFHAEVLFDHVLASGQKLQFAAAEDVALERPGRLFVDWTGDLGARRFWYDGAAITLYDPSTPFFASAPAAADLDGMLNAVEADTGFAPPLADVLYRDPYAAVAGKIRYGVDLGDKDVDGKTCRMLAFVSDDIDWQVWIDAGPQPVPCKIVITYKTHPSQPQFSATFGDWDFAPRIAASTFTPDLPAGTRKVDFAKVGSAK